MPVYAHLATDLHCPYCEGLVTDMVLFQWGYCPTRGEPPDRLIYHVGDAVRWRRCRDGSIRAWTYFKDGQFGEEANIGDPAVGDLITRDVKQFYWDDPGERLRCPVCGEPLDGAAVEIRDGTIRRAWIYLSGEFPQVTDYMLIGPDGDIIPKPNWDDHPMGNVATC